MPWCSFSRLKQVLTAPGIDCTCDLIAAAGALTDLDGNPTPALYGFTRIVDGDLRLAPVHAHTDDDLITNTELRSRGCPFRC